MSRILVEACVESRADAVAAVGAGADRIEINDDLLADGLTPRAGVVRAIVSAVCVPVIAMVRPRPADFVYDETDRIGLRTDLGRMCEEGAHGVAFGALTRERHVEEAVCAELVTAARATGLQTVFHRAFDVVTDRTRALETLIDLGFDRVLTSGGAPSASEGLAELRDLVQQAAGRITILPGGGVRSTNAAMIVEATGCREIHGSFRGAGGSFDAAELVRTVDTLGS